MDVRAQGPGSRENAPPSAAASAMSEGRVPDGFDLDTGLRSHAARGTVINAAFQVSLAGLNFLRQLGIAAFLTAQELGIWGALIATLMVVVFLKDVGLADRFIQQSDDDQEHAFQQLFTIDLLLSVVVVALAAVVIPVFALAYGESKIIAPGLVAALAVIGQSLQSPTWVFYRRMDFKRQRILQAVDPVIAFVATLGLAIAGLGIWSLVLGGLAGAFAGAAVALRMSPYRIALRLEKGTIADYFNFSWPLVVAQGGGLAVIQGSLLVATRTISIGAAGGISVAGSISQFAKGVDSIVTGTLYPAICAVRDRSDLMFEAFVKSNRLALMWGLPFGIGVALFASDLVDFLIGDRWTFAIGVIQAFGIAAAIDQIGFNWTAFLRALNRTKPLAFLAILNLAAFAVITVPLLVLDGLRGFAIGWVAASAVTLVARTYFLQQLFPGLGVVRHIARSALPVLPPTAVVLGVRQLESGDRTLGLALAELGGFLLITVVVTTFSERRLLAEVFAYLRPRLMDRASRTAT